MCRLVATEDTVHKVNLNFYHRQNVVAKEVYSLTGNEGKHTYQKRFIPVHALFNLLSPAQQIVLVSIILCIWMWHSELLLWTWQGHSFPVSSLLYIYNVPLAVYNQNFHVCWLLVHSGRIASPLEIGQDLPSPWSYQIFITLPWLAFASN